MRFNLIYSISSIIILLPSGEKIVVLVSYLRA